MIRPTSTLAPYKFISISEVLPTEAPLPNPKIQASFPKVQAFKFILRHAVLKLRFSRLLFPKSNLHSSFANLFNFKFSKTCQSYIKTWGFFLGWGGFINPFQSHSKGLYKDLNDSVNHPKLSFGSFEICFRHIRNYSTAENYFLRLDFRKLSPENE